VCKVEGFQQAMLGVGTTAHKGHIFRFLSVPLYTGLTVLCF
jgi:hypothetical protein